MKPSTSTVALGLLLSFTVPGGMAMAADPGEQILLERAAFWRAQQRLDVATETLNKLLALNPNQPDALYQLAAIATQRGDPGGARIYVDRLRQMAASDPRAAQLMAPTSSVAAPAAAPAPPVKPAVAAAKPSLAAAPPHVNAPARDLPDLVAVSADSNDLTPALPVTRTAAQTVATPAAASERQPRAVQLASLSEGTVSDATTATAPVAVATARQGSGDLSITAPPVQVAQLELMPPPPVGGYQGLASVVPYQPTDTLEMDIDRNLSQLEQQANPTWTGGVGFRWHDGTSGLNQLTEVGTPGELSFAPWYTGTARFTVLPVYLDAGTLGPSNVNLFGANPLLAARGFAGISPGAQDAGGVGLLGGYSYGDFTGQFGTSPLGFLVTNLVGSAAYQPKFLDNTLSIRFEGLRQPVTDSVLSYAGTRASTVGANVLSNNGFETSDIWGGVVKTGGNVSAFYDDTMYGGYASVGLAELTGRNVAGNGEIDALLGAYFRPYKTENTALRVGVSAYYTGFDKNLSGFTFGQGGYFSPQNFIAVTVPVEYTGHNGPWSYLGSVALGVQHSNVDRSPIFPNNAGAQAALELTPGAVAFDSGTTSTGLAASLKGQVEYAIDNTTSVGAAVSFDNGNSYNEVIAKLYLRKTFDWLSPAPVASTSDPVAIARRDQPQSRL